MKGLLATMRNAISEAAANRKGLAFAMTVMILNDVMWIAFWLIFFRTAASVRGWDRDQVLMLLAVLTTSGGIALGLLANARRLGTMALGGELDAILNLPVQPLAFLLVRRIEPTNLGDVVFGLGLFAIAGHPTPMRALLFVLVVAASSTLIVSFLVLTGSLAFFIGRNDGGELGFHALLLLGAYPADVFAGAAKVMLYTVVPAAFVSSVPARLVNSFELSNATLLLAVASGFAGTSIAVFHRGLRRYRSGAVWTRA